MICITKKKSQKLLQNFNNDPFSNIGIKTQSTVLHLVLNYLTIDSQYFNNVALDTREIDLSQLPQKYLIRVLKALYGDELYAGNIKQLVELYNIIQFLEISDFRHNIETNIKANPQLMDSLQLLEFSMNTGILKEQLKNHHFKNKLKTISNSKNYLQLNKLSQINLNELLISYSQKYGSADDQNVNYILENYFGRNQISSFEYFKDPELLKLKTIWEKFHHSITYMDQCRTNQQKIKQSQIITNIQQKQTNTFPFSSVNNFNPVSQQIIKKDQQLEELEKTLELKEQIIESLREEIRRAREDNQRRNNESLEGEVDEDSMLGDVMKYKSKKESENYLSGDFEMSIIEPAFDNDRKIVNDQREVKTMNRLNSRSKRIFHQ